MGLFRQSGARCGVKFTGACILALTLYAGILPVTSRVHAGGDVIRAVNLEPYKTTQFAQTAYDLIRNDDPETPVRSDEDLMVGTFDINDDGIDELFILVDTSYTCGTAGCDINVFEKRAGKWVKRAQVSGFAVGVGAKVGGATGYRTLYGELDGYRWNGTKYKGFCLYPDDPEKCPQG